MKKNGFTLAEVLITLGIIGVVAALTLPALIQNYKKQALKAGFRKAYSVLTNTFNLMQDENGVRAVSEDFSSADVLKSRLLEMKRLNIMNECGTRNGVGRNCFSNSQLVANYKNYSKLAAISGSWFDDGQLILGDGMIIMLERQSGEPRGLFVSVDVNGYNKPPNAWGHDVFTFELTKQGAFLPEGAPGTLYEGNSEVLCLNTSTSSINGLTCAQKAISDPDYFENLP
ncbi:MAG: prepilin-type N-terminal cleavage/methylation domain-containing protein [Heliobacteriaceae bacterium]|jgi:prepilin-type N-terminal cleavage/methylation domain-containing protein|nr:prepilin-type N-terminal cleavage/methylation domain-containing protein [Heliobacteriaceae bacterium]